MYTALINVLRRYNCIYMFECIHAQVELVQSEDLLNCLTSGPKAGPKRAASDAL